MMKVMKYVKIQISIILQYIQWVDKYNIPHHTHGHENRINTDCP